MHFAFSIDRLRAALLQHVQHGPPVTRHVRQEESDACLNFMQSDAADALRVPTVMVPADDARDESAGDMHLDAVAVPRCKATETRR